jgi:DNA-binding beta-propeller fold protein YncE
MAGFLASLCLASVLAGSAAVANGAVNQNQTAAHFGRLFTFVGDYPVGPATSRTDYESIDPVARRLYVTMMGDGDLVVFDIVHGKVLSRLDGYPKVTGVLAVPELRRLYASVPGSGIASAVRVGLGMLGLSSGTGAVVVLDSDSLKEVGRLRGAVFPDGIAYDPADQKIFVSDELGSAILAIDARTNRLVARIRTAGEVGNVQYDGITSKVFAPVQTRNELAIIDPVKATLVSRIALRGCEHPHGLAIAPKMSVGYVACDANDVLLVVDLKSGRVLSSLPTAHDPDVMAIDAELKRLYVASESGFLSTFDISEPKSPVSMGAVLIGDDAHAVAVDPVTHELYFGLANLNGHAVLRVLAPRSPVD